jgi:N-sulfoglucosamine sulfohydrolase
MNFVRRLTMFVSIVFVLANFAMAPVASAQIASAQIATPQTATADRPHVVMCFADDWGRYASVYGQLEPGGINDVVSTPHFDALANQGVLFTRAFVSAPSCTPCRSSLMSGQHFWRCNRASILRGAIWDGTVPSYPLMLQDAGYRLGHTYKVWSPGEPANAPHGGKKTAFNSAGAKFNQFSSFVMKAKDRQAAKSKLLGEVRRNIRSFLDANGDSKLDGDQPIAYFFGPTNCHRKWQAGSGKMIWGINPDDLKGKLPPYFPDVPLVRQDVADYLGEVMAFDAAVGVIREELHRVGIEDNTLLAVSGDHGMPGVPRGKCNLYDLGTHVSLAIRWPQGIRKPGRVVSDFVSLPDLAPTFLEASGVIPANNMTARSLMPILSSDKSGRVDPKRDAVFTGRERHVDVARAGLLPYPQRAIRTDDHLFIINFAPDRTPMGDGPFVAGSAQKMPEFESLRENTMAAYPDMDASPTKAWVMTHRDSDPESFELAVGLRPKYELYDVVTDPHCMINLADDPKHQGVQDRLRQRLTDELQSTGDPRVSDQVIFESSPFTDRVGKEPIPK